MYLPSKHPLKVLKRLLGSPHKHPSLRSAHHSASLSIRKAWGDISTWNTTWHVPWLQSWTPLQDVLPQSHYNELANQIRSLSFSKSFRQEQSSQMPTGLTPNSLAWHTTIFMPVPCILLQSHSLLLKYEPHIPKCSIYTFQGWHMLSYHLFHMLVPLSWMFFWILIW